MFMFKIGHKAIKTLWLHDPAKSAPVSLEPKPDKKTVMAKWGTSRLEEEHKREVDLHLTPPKPFFPMDLVLVVYPSNN